MIFLGIIAWYSVRARSCYFVFSFIHSYFCSFFPYSSYSCKSLWCKCIKMENMGLSFWLLFLVRYFYYILSSSIIFDEKIDSKQKYMYAEYPHGVYVFFFFFFIFNRTPIGCLISGFAFPRFSPDVPCYISFFIQLPMIFPLLILSYNR